MRAIGFVYLYRDKTERISKIILISCYLHRHFNMNWKYLSKFHLFQRYGEIDRIHIHAHCLKF